MAIITIIVIKATNVNLQFFQIQYVFNLYIFLNDE